MLEIASEHGAEDIHLPSPPTRHQPADESFGPRFGVIDGLFTVAMRGGQTRHFVFWRPAPEPHPEPPDDPEHLLTPERLERIRAARNAKLALLPKGTFYVNLSDPPWVEQSVPTPRDGELYRPNHKGTRPVGERRKPASPLELHPPNHEPACGLTSLYRSQAPSGDGQHDHHVWAYRKPGRDGQHDHHVWAYRRPAKDEWLKRLGKSSFRINDMPPEDRVLALYAEGKRLAPLAAKPRKERTEFRDSEYDPARSWDDGPELRESIIDSNDDPTDEGYDSATKPSGYQFKRLKAGLRRTKVDVDVEERDRTHLRNEVRRDPNRLLRLILGSSDICFSRQKKGKKPAYKVASRHCEDILNRVLVPGGDILVERNRADRYTDVDALRFFREYVERNVDLGDRYFLPKRHPHAVPAWTYADKPVLLPDYTDGDKRQAWPRIKRKQPPGIEVARGFVMWPPEIVLSVMVHGINIGLRERDREPDYFNPPTCLDPIGPPEKGDVGTWLDDLKKRGLTETVDSFYMVGRRRYNTTTERVSLRRTAEPLSELITSFKDAKPVASACRIFTAAEREGYRWEKPHPLREWRERGRLKRRSEAGGYRGPPLRTWPMPRALPVKRSGLTIGEGDATYVRPGTKTTPAATMVVFAKHQAVSEWFAMGVLDSEAAKQPCETQSLSERVHIKRGQRQEWSELGAADDEVVEVDKSIKYTSGSVECGHLTIDIGGVCTFKRGRELWNAAT